jgi:inward rectifier potassium channel
MRRREKSARTSIGSYRFTKKGISQFDFTDPYHMAVAFTWPQYLLSLLGLYLTANTLFALLYLVVPGSVANARPYDFGDAFFFSLETLATVGYGEMYPGSLYGHCVAAAEIITGLAFTAILTGLTFVRFSRPRAKFLFATNPVITLQNGVPTLMLRIGNGRANVMNDASAKLNALIDEKTAEGASFRRATELRLLRSHIPVFPLSWTLMHPIDKKSPLYGFDAATFLARDTRIFASMEARDPTLAAMVHGVANYRPDEVLFGKRYVDIIGAEADGTPVIDLTRISDVEPDTGHGAEEPGWTPIEQLEEEEGALPIA